jgi:Lon protease-like protein
MSKTVPLFPLHAVLFPGGSLPLRIFEPRYLEMVSHCMKNGTGFGVCLIREGEEIGKAAQTYETGTLAEISYFDQKPGGLLEITAHGIERFRILNSEIQSNQLTMAEVDILPNDIAHAIPHELAQTVDVLQDLLKQLDYPFIREPFHYEDAAWVGGRLAELLPLRLEQKQHFLQMTDPIERLECIWGLLRDWRIR